MEKQVFKPNFNFDEFEKEAKAAIHAINNHDRLVERIEQLEKEKAELRGIIANAKEYAQMISLHIRPKFLSDDQHTHDYEHAEHWLEQLKGNNND